MRMSDYKHTLNLPQTSFPMKANLATREPQLLAHWKSESLYQTIREARQGRPRFILHDGPPYANGHLHCGHALNKILKDMIVKSKTLHGYDAPFVPGWDCHGLPVELNVEKKTGKANVKISAQDFREQCRAYAASQVNIQRQEFQRLGVLGDWDKPYLTMNYTYEANILRALGMMLDQGHIHKGVKPVHWCIDCGSALAEAEADYEDKTSTAIDVAFFARDPAQFIQAMGLNRPCKPFIVPIWTTTPWTLPANEAVCLHPELAYVCLDVGPHYLLVADGLKEAVLTRYGITDAIPCGEAPGRVFEHLSLKHPLYDKSVPVILGEHVTLEAGTGSVHTAPVHGTDDYIVGLRYDLPLNNPVLANGTYHADVPLFAGHHVQKVEKLMLETLKQQHTLLHEEPLQHSYPHCWRHKTPLIFLATPQWFVSMEQAGLRETLLKIIPQVEWKPEWGQARITDMVKKRPDWCISRQRTWGTPIPFFLHKTTGELHPKTSEFIEAVAKRVEKEGIEAWFKLDPVEILGEEAASYEKGKDTLDVWFDSGVTHFCVLKHQYDQLSFPADLYLEGSDQHRGWFNSSLTTAGAMYGVAPYKMVLTHGYTVDAEGKKLSKSKGNYIALDEVINQYGADVLRLWVCSTDYRHEVNISKEILTRTADTYRRIRNTARFLLSNLFDFDPSRDLLPQDQLVELDRWILHRAQTMQNEIITAYEQYQFHNIYQHIQHLCSIDLGSFYLDIIKDRQYTTPVNSRARRSCQTAMYHILQALTRWLAPILSFTAEEMWQAMPGYANDSVFVQTWYEQWPMINTVNAEHWQDIQNLRDVVNKILETQRQAGAFGSALAAEVTLYADGASYDTLQALGDELRFVLMTSRATLKRLHERPEGAWMDETLQLAIVAHASEAPKCTRCWHRLPDVGTHSDHPELCGRCIGNLEGHDEQRQFA